MNPGNDGPDAWDLKYFLACSISLNCFGFFISLMEKHHVFARLAWGKRDTCWGNETTDLDTQNCREGLIRMSSDIAVHVTCSPAQ